MNDLVVNHGGNVIGHALNSDSVITFVSSEGAAFIRISDKHDIWIDPRLGRNEAAIEFWKCVKMAQSFFGLEQVKLPDRAVVDLLELEDDMRKEAAMSRAMNEDPAISDKLMEFVGRLNKAMHALENRDDNRTESSEPVGT